MQIHAKNLIPGPSPQVEKGAPVRYDGVNGLLKRTGWRNEEAIIGNKKPLKISGVFQRN
jgi:hypothetical protein